MHSLQMLGDVPAVWLANEPADGGENPYAVFGAFAAASAFLIFRVVLGVLAYTGRWRRWHQRNSDTMNRTPYSPFYFMWLSVAGLCILGPLTVGEALALLGVVENDGTDPPLWLLMPFLCTALLASLVACLYAIYPPKWALPRYVREAEGRDRPRGDRTPQEDERPEPSS
ncbi:hypothetical protein [Thermomonospora cellulosilytica]|uniref:Amino acid permease n=1 Tax=Thermomonospora cellulosilytica TaxID=1411118 RepID=A0A7W3MWG5_9ACTN|nr:hypothetical protein [Thermomonospora cellulosilytica]MBA9003168.1 amino acid permease [Thermomonospora cellulosilytica]